MVNIIEVLDLDWKSRTALRVVLIKYEIKNKLENRGVGGWIMKLQTFGVGGQQNDEIG